MLVGVPSNQKPGFGANVREVRSVLSDSEASPISKHVLPCSTPCSIGMVFCGAARMRILEPGGRCPQHGEYLTRRRNPFV